MSPWTILFALLGVFLALRFLLRMRPTTTPADAAARVAAGIAVLIDVREANEWTQGVAAPAHLLPLSDLRGPRHQWTPFLEKHRDKELLLYCQSGIRSHAAAQALQKSGFKVANCGGYPAWVKAGLPVRTPHL